MPLIAANILLNSIPLLSKNAPCILHPLKQWTRLGRACSDEYTANNRPQASERGPEANVIYVAEIKNIHSVSRAESLN